MKYYPRIDCRVCGKEVERTKSAGRPRKAHVACLLDLPTGNAQHAVNVNEPGETPNMVAVSEGEFWNAMAAKALIRRQAEQTATAAEEQAAE